MDKRRSYFLVAAEECNFSKAAKRLFVSQQCLSAYIKNMEQEFGVELFSRKPRLKLTLAGEHLLHTFQRMQILEQNLKGEMRAIASGQRGRITLGVHSARSQAVLPPVLERYWREYPDSVVDVVDGMTPDFEKRLLDGSMDLYFGVNPLAHPLIRHQLLSEEGVFLIISDPLLQRYFPDRYPECKKSFRQGADLKDFQHIPFVMNHDSSSTTDLIYRYLDANNISLPIRLFSNSGPLRVNLCALDLAAHIGMQILAKYPAMYSGGDPRYDRLNFFPVNGFPKGSKITLSCQANVHQPLYLRRFIDIAIETLNELYAGSADLSGH